MNSTKVQTVTVRKTNYRESRAHDYIYDPVHSVPGPKDHQRCSIQAARQSVQFQICPVYNSMFTDLNTLPRNVLAVKSWDRVPPCVDRSWAAKQRSVDDFALAKKLDVDGMDRHRFFRRPMVPFLTPVITQMRYPRPPPQHVEEQHAATGAMEEADAHTKATQTDYRESETQTDPYSPPYYVTGDTTPEIISLAHLSWGRGLPAGMHEVEIIERARIKRAWEKSLPPVTDLPSIDKRRQIIEAIERDEWVFREAEIQHINDLRLELTRRLIGEKMGELTAKHDRRVNKYKMRKQLSKERKLVAIRHDTSRALRKLRMKHQGVNLKYHKTNVVDDHDDRRSEWYGPQMRYGDNPRRGHEVIHCRSRFLTHIKGLEVLEKMPKLLPGFDSIRFAAPQPKRGYELCIRETRWTEEKLRKLHQDLKEIRLKRFERRAPLRLLQRVPIPIPVPETPAIEGVPDWEEDIFQAAICLQKVVKGRAIQTIMYRGRDKCRELIEELKSTHALHEAGMIQRAEERFEIMSQQREHQLEIRKKEELNEMLSSLEGQTIASTLDFLSKELWRLQDERRAHAFALLAERERHRREAAEAGRRQIEERRRKEHDEMFKQIVKVHQDTVDIYLEDLIIDSMGWVAETEARQYVRDLALRVDEAAQEAHRRKDCIEQEEIIADLIHNFVVPEVQKQLVREKMKKRQAKYLAAAHDVIYEKMDNLPSRPASPTLRDEASRLSSFVRADQDIPTIQAEMAEMASQLVDAAVARSHKVSGSTTFSSSALFSGGSQRIETDANLERARITMSTSSASDKNADLKAVLARITSSSNFTLDYSEHERTTEQADGVSEIETAYVNLKAEDISVVNLMTDIEGLSIDKDGNLEEITSEKVVEVTEEAITEKGEEEKRSGTITGDKIDDH